MLALVAGVHGSEYSPILALQSLLPKLDPLRLSGKLILVHVANIPSFLGRTVYTGLVDGKNLNRSFPGKADGTLSERIMHTLTTRASPVSLGRALHLAISDASAASRAGEL